jgi:hypothetical protein
MKKKLALIVGTAALAVGNASAALTTTDLTTGISGAITTGEGLIVAGFAVTGLFIVVKIIKKAAAKIG